MPRKRRPMPEDDRALWRTVTADIAPLAGQTPAPAKPKPPKRFLSLQTAIHRLTVKNRISLTLVPSYRTVEMA